MVTECVSFCILFSRWHVIQPVHSVRMSVCLCVCVFVSGNNNKYVYRMIWTNDQERMTIKTHCTLCLFCFSLLFSLSLLSFFLLNRQIITYSCIFLQVKCFFHLSWPNDKTRTLNFHVKCVSRSFFVVTCFVFFLFLLHCGSVTLFLVLLLFQFYFTRNYDERKFKSVYFMVNESLNRLLRDSSQFNFSA